MLLVVCGVLLALPGLLTAIHLTIISLASVAYRRPATEGALEQQFLVLVPARNEATVIRSTLRSLRQSIRDGDTILVVADRCSDDTAEIAAAEGAVVLERPDDSTPGKAAALADGLARAATLDWSALTIIDADSVVSEGFFDELERVLGEHQPLAQPRSEHIRGRGLLARASEAAFAMQGVTLPRGRQALGIGVRLRGTGMTMLRPVADGTPYATGGASEDLFISLDLLLDGMTAVHVDDARLASLSAPSYRAGGQQRIRWEQGRLDAARTYIPKLLRRRSAAAFEAAVLLATPPYAVAVFLLGAGALLAWAGGSASVALLLSAGIGLLAMDLAIALVQTRAPMSTWLSLLAAPVYVIWKAGLQVVAIVRSRRSREAWEPTNRG